MRLNDTIIRNTQPGSKPIKLPDGDGLYLLVQPNGSRWWRMRYYVDGVEKTLSVGVYPEVSLKRARERRHEIRTQVANGTNPSDDRKTQRNGREQTFELVAREWWEKRRHLWKDEYANVILTRFSQDVFSYIGMDSARWRRPCSMSRGGIRMPSNDSFRIVRRMTFVRHTTMRSTCRSGGR